MASRLPYRVLALVLFVFVVQDGSAALPPPTETVDIEVKSLEASEPVKKMKKASVKSPVKGKPDAKSKTAVNSLKPALSKKSEVPAQPLPPPPPPAVPLTPVTPINP